MVSDKELQEIIDAYNVLVKGISQKAIDNKESRAYGGIVRAGKGTMLENIAKTLVILAWKDFGKDEKSFKLFVDRKVEDPYPEGALRDY